MGRCTICDRPSVIPPATDGGLVRSCACLPLLRSDSSEGRSWQSAVCARITRVKVWPQSQEDRRVKREVTIKSPLGEDVLLFEQLHGEEKLGGGFEYQLSALSENHSIDLSALVGETITVK